MQWIKAITIAVMLSISLIATAAPAGKININTATAAELEQLDGIGKAKAEAIVQYRKSNGRFSNVEQLSQVKGVGPALVEKNRPRLALE